MSAAEAFALAAEGLAGTRFRLHGRDPATGIDCVGLVVAALAHIARTVPEPNGLYALKNSAIDRALALPRLAGLIAVSGAAMPGDVVLVRVGPAQCHVLILLAGDRFVHAHAGLGRVVVTPGPLVWPIEGRWRLPPNEGC